VERSVGYSHVIRALAKQLKNEVPGLLIIGQVAALQSNLAWFNPE
jgi:siroheme synthase